MELRLSELFGLTDEEINNSKIEANMTEGKGGKNCIDVWLKYSDEEKASGKFDDFLYWGWYGKNQRNFYPGRVVFSLVKINNLEWLLVSVGKIIDVPKGSRAIVEIVDK
ncbi:MAG: hypothetical protein K6F63_06175, partial [Lachnospiraceae bacterium]|nr:hypothetical protein [Lachnospiraceae bacterium]